ncbi:hypothetical protein BHE74_00059736 [Ensete ventricosum]|nr:hypothetical protein BHE74_00059736 [Ensete ventricosum]
MQPCSGSPPPCFLPLLSALCSLLSARAKLHEGRSFGMQLRYASNTVMKAMQLFRLSTATLPSTALCSG